MYITSVEKLAEKNLQVVEHMGFLKERMVFSNNDSKDLFTEESLEIEIKEKKNEFWWHKEKVLDCLIDSAEKDGANALLGLKFWFTRIKEDILIVYAYAAYAKVEKIF